MKQKSNENPIKIHNLGDGTYHFNYNVVEVTDEVGSVLFEYDQVLIKDSPTRSNIIASLVRTKYSLNDELSVLRQKDVKPEKFNDYFNFTEGCKAIVDENLEL